MTKQAPLPDPDGWLTDDEAAPKAKPRFQLVLTPDGRCGQAEAVRRLRAALKYLLRTHRLRCVHAQELKPDEKPKP